MLTRAISSSVVIALGSLILAGCQTAGTPEPAPAQTEPVQREVVPQRETRPEQPARPRRERPVVRNGQLFQPGEDGKLVALEGVFYFDYDRAVVKPGSFRELSQHARHLVRNRRVTLRLEGHCDERGTREYNLALGELRANSIRQYLLNQGVRETQIETISYGEEKPAARGSDERTWALSRRVHLRYE